MKFISKKAIAVFQLSAIFLIFFPVIVSAETSPYKCMTFDFANDMFFGTDRGFTGGGKFNWLWELAEIPDGKPRKSLLPFIKTPGYRHAISFSIGMNVYTPDDIRIPDLIPSDRPYAGYFFVSLGVHSFNNQWKETISFDVGVIGPWAMAEKTQKFIHKVVDVQDPKGWHNQLKNEITFQIYYENRLKFLRAPLTKRFSFELIPHFGGGAGNVYIYAHSGAQMRMGWNLPEDFGIPISRPDGETDPNYQYYTKSGLYVFAALDGQAVLRNIFLDGNTFLSSHHVEKHTFTGNLVLGVSLTLGRVNFSFAMVRGTKKYTTESVDQKNGILSVSFSY